MRIINCAVVDDEPIARAGIKEFIDQIDYLSFVGYANDINSTIELLAHETIDLLFLDINMPGLSGIDFVKTLRHKKPMIVFITAYSHYAVESYELNVLDYLMKPVSFNRFNVAAERALKTIALQNKSKIEKDYLFVRAEGRLEKINIQQIMCIASLQNYIKIHLVNGESYIVHSTLKGFHNQLNASHFLMVHKCYIININFIHSITGNQIKIDGFGNVPIGRFFKQNINSFLLNQ